MILAEKSVKKSKMFFLFISIVVLVFILSQCTKKYPGATDSLSLGAKDGCVNCHLDQDKLQKVADPLPHIGEDAGEG